MTNKEIHLPDGLDPDTAADVLREYARHDEPTMTEADTLESLRDEIAQAKEAFAAVLAEQSPQSADTLARQDMDALTEPFRDDDGDIDVDTLQQTPETQSGRTGDGGDGDSDGFDPETLTLSEQEQLQRLEKKRNSFEQRGIDKRVDLTEEKMCEIAGADDYDTLRKEVF